MHGAHVERRTTSRCHGTCPRKCFPPSLSPRQHTRCPCAHTPGAGLVREAGRPVPEAGVQAAGEPAEEDGGGAPHPVPLPHPPGPAYARVQRPHHSGAQDGGRDCEQRAQGASQAASPGEAGPSKELPSSTERAHRMRTLCFSPHCVGTWSRGMILASGAIWVTNTYEPARGQGFDSPSSPSFLPAASTRGDGGGQGPSNALKIRREKAAAARETSAKSTLPPRSHASLRSLPLPPPPRCS